MNQVGHPSFLPIHYTQTLLTSHDLPVHCLPKIKILLIFLHPQDFSFHCNIKSLALALCIFHLKTSFLSFIFMSSKNNYAFSPKLFTLPFPPAALPHFALWQTLPDFGGAVHFLLRVPKRLLQCSLLFRAYYRLICFQIHCFRNTTTGWIPLPCFFSAGLLYPHHVHHTFLAFTFSLEFNL